MSRAPTFAKRLLAWWDVHGRHDLPWQHPRTPYRVWISEIMLQQTQVATVVPYFERWMERLPDLGTLAKADLDEVLALWSGLGYYARARNLHRAACLCLDRHAGRLPETAVDLAALPGIGASTANAIVSQAHDIPLPILDGNARRVLARHAAIAGWPGKSKVQKKLWREAERRLPSDRGADYTQAIMDLGATICSRGRPACGDCPVGADCRALAEDRVRQFPGRKPETKTPAVNLHFLILERDDGAVLLERRPGAGIWGGLWCLPEAKGAAQLAHRFGLASNRLTALPAVEHRLTHRRLTLHPMRSPAHSATVIRDANLGWFGPSDWPGLGLPKPVRSLLENLGAAQS